MLCPFSFHNWIWTICKILCRNFSWVWSLCRTFACRERCGAVRFPIVQSRCRSLCNSCSVCAEPVFSREISLRLTLFVQIHGDGFPRGLWQRLCGMTCHGQSLQFVGMRISRWTSNIPWFSAFFRFSLVWIRFRPAEDRCCRPYASHWQLSSNSAS